METEIINFNIDDKFDSDFGKKVWDHVYKLTGNANLTAGILANLYQESRLNHNSVSSKGARGIAQLLGTKYKNYQNYLAKNKLKDTWDNQLTYVINFLKDPKNDEWTNDYRRVKAVTELPLKEVVIDKNKNIKQRRYIDANGGWYPADEYDKKLKTFNPKWIDYSYEMYNNVDWDRTSPEQAAEIFLNVWERPSEKEAMTDVRKGAAKHFYNLYYRPTKQYKEGGSIEKSKTITINDKEYIAYFAETERQREEGLSEVSEMDMNEVMTFIFPEPILAQDCIFTCADMSFDIDIAFVDGEDTIVSVVLGEAGDKEPIIPNCNPSTKIAYVIELNANSGVKVGDEVDLDNEGVSEDEVEELYILGPDGQPQGVIQTNSRIFSRIHTRQLIKKAKKANKTKSDSDYKKLGKLVFDIMYKHSTQEPEYVDSPSGD